jgi:RNA polymerase sigma-70 factor (ECF subfamily)
MDNYNDIELVQLSLGGDARAFEHLVKRHYMSAYTVSYKWCGIKEDAEDIAQEVVVKLARKLKTFGQRSSFKTWFYRMTINTAKDFTRKYTTKRVYETAFTLEQSSNNPVPAPDENPDAAQLYREIAKLPEKQKMAVLLVYGEGLSHKEASQVLKCPETTVSWRIFQAKKKLKKSLEYEK